MCLLPTQSLPLLSVLIGTNYTMRSSSKKETSGRQNTETVPVDNRTLSIGHTDHRTLGIKHVDYRTLRLHSRIGRWDFVKAFSVLPPPPFLVVSHLMKSASSWEIVGGAFVVSFLNLISTFV